jgi:hypothetical protein
VLVAALVGVVAFVLGRTSEPEATAATTGLSASAEALAPTVVSAEPPVVATAEPLPTENVPPLPLPPPAMASTPTLDTAFHRPPPLEEPPPRGPLYVLATSSNPADWQRARDVLEPKVFGQQSATKDEIRMLRMVCKTQHDYACIEAIGRLK